jgi:hypothetical protein
VRSGRRASAGAEQAENLAVVRPAALTLLREDELAVGEYVELGLLALADRGVDPVLLQFGRETRGPFVVPASDGAVEDLDAHCRENRHSCRAHVAAILGGVNEDDLRRLENLGSEVNFSAGKVLIERGQPGTGLFVVVEGTLVVEAPEQTREIGPGEVVGERALLSADGTRTARVRALTDGTLVAVDRAEIDRLCADDPAFAERLASAS